MTINKNKLALNNKFALSCFCFAIIHLAVLLAYYFWNVYYYNNGDTSWYWKTPLFFTQQNNFMAFLLFLLTGIIIKNKQIGKYKYTDNLRIFHLSWISTVMVAYWSVIMPNEIKDGNMTTGYFLFTFWVHAIVPVLCIIHFHWMNKHYSFNNNEISVKKDLPISLFYPLVYTGIVVFLVQWLDPNHFSVYLSATEWYYWVDPSILDKQPNYQNPAPWSIPILFVLIIIFYLIFSYWYKKVNQKI